MTEWQTHSRKRERLDHIDALRGIAVAAVFAQHVAEQILQSKPAAPWVTASLHGLLLQGTNLGRYGVIVFFLISGFVVPFAFRGAHPVRSFVVSRMFRLYPAYWLAILGSVVVACAAGHAFPLRQVLANLTMLQRLFGVANIRVAFWTLFIEVIFYCLVMLLYTLGQLRRVAILGTLAFGCILLAVIPACLRYVLGWPIPSPDDPIFIAYMLTGSVLRMAVDGDVAAPRWAGLLVLLLLAAAPILGGAIFPVSSNGNPFLTPLALTTAYPLALLTFVVAIWLQRPRCTALNRLGLISYSVYLGHGLVIFTLGSLIPPGVDLVSELRFLIGTVAFTLPLAVLSYRYIERPCIAFSRRITADTVPARAAEVAP
ncbi:acyltransferase family protein [Sphingomonas nostoxanthinifaciens]|uniref:acyltransferase family protein n=1 Tax=Sphingomonas nostoxanthinifaciens TaxID=2872652 RepID=UPI001CC1EB64|nr:acyltransferase [Sphingomonas nostoxanthinifaciens]UAK23117.1 acyltransferase [Sphingomonas nostoxanthinifaciens]